LKKYLLFFLFVLPLSFIGQRSSFATDGDIDNQNFPTETVIAEPDTLTADELLAQKRLSWFFANRYRNDHFNGSVLVAHNGKIVFQQHYGYADIRARKKLNDELPFELASVSKTFTSAAVLKLVAAGKLQFDDTVANIVPDFPYKKITIRHLLSHRSGLQDYVFMDKRYISYKGSYMTNQEVADIFSKRKLALLFATDTRFHYSNSNYALLAHIVAKISGQRFQTYVRDSIFIPLDMQHSFVFDFTDSLQPLKAQSHDSLGRKLGDTYRDGVVGDKGIFSTTMDMIKWDNALRNGKVLTLEMLDEAYTPRSFERVSFGDCKSRNYGYGWRLANHADGKNIVYHNGWWHGNNNVFARNMSDNTTIIVLGNRLNNGNYYIDPIWTILKPLKVADKLLLAQQ